jgi:kynurenine formamidase
MNKWIYLSYPLNSTTPAYGGGATFNVREEKCIKKGDSCNTQYWRLSNHLGTHIDFPKHFDREGKTACDYPAAFWIFDFPFVVDISPIPRDSIIQMENITLTGVPDKIDLLIVKTGFSLLRGENIYCKNNPGFAPELAAFLRERFPRLRVMGFDSISVSSFAHRETGRKSHKAFLDDPQPILLLEDMDLSGVDGNSKLKQIIVSPLNVEEADASPCTIFAKIVE